MPKQKRLSIAEAKALAIEWEADWERHCFESAVDDHFRDASGSQLVSMWESRTNEKGQALTNFEFQALCSAWLQVFGCLPPDSDAADASTAEMLATPQEPQPADDTMVSPTEAARMAGVSLSTIKRMVLDDRFPKPMRLSPRRIGWPAREVKAWLRQLDDQRHARRQ
ncbi:MAG TPA: AlpA family phage regulatory protein [Hyphomicrobiaceae bacterium]|nr:AlpA family phage regulatory protein [Hyphomicrobiaceae bacterium]